MPIAKNLSEFYSDTGPERCGIVTHSGEVIELNNVHPEPDTGFEIDSQEVFLYLDDLNGVWHTHPGATSVLSGADRGYMLFWPRAKHYVAGKDGVTQYAVEDDVVYDENHFPW